MILKFIKSIIPPKQWRRPVLIVMGIFVGGIIIILRISNATAYLSDDPKACINCHVMFPQYETWNHSSHRAKATCNDCHVPHDSVINKYSFKAKDGLRHAAIYTLKKEPQVIRMHEEGQKTVQANCIRCHQELLDGSRLVHGDYQDYLNGNARLCWHCHREVPHGRVRSLAATPYYNVPQLSDSVPVSFQTLRTFIENISDIKEDKKHE